MDVCIDGSLNYEDNEGAKLFTRMLRYVLDKLKDDSSAEKSIEMGAEKIVRYLTKEKKTRFLKYDKDINKYEVLDDQVVVEAVIQLLRNDYQERRDLQIADDGKYDSLPAARRQDDAQAAAPRNQEIARNQVPNPLNQQVSKRHSQSGRETQYSLSLPPQAMAHPPPQRNDDQLFDPYPLDQADPLMYLDFAMGAGYNTEQGYEVHTSVAQPHPPETYGYAHAQHPPPPGTYPGHPPMHGAYENYHPLQAHHHSRQYPPQPTPPQYTVPPPPIHGQGYPPPSPIQMHGHSVPHPSVGAHNNFLHGHRAPTAQGAIMRTQTPTTLQTHRGTHRGRGRSRSKMPPTQRQLPPTSQDNPIELLSDDDDDDKKKTEVSKVGWRKITPEEARILIRQGKLSNIYGVIPPPSLKVLPAHMPGLWYREPPDETLEKTLKDIQENY